ncbi:MAG: trypsin-like peptidase domain-containing protein [Thermoguttaceae bacterium]|nr:trypsin-like peptidase domain-containing protein [Thermoguttaceae bacterium]
MGKRRRLRAAALCVVAEQIGLDDIPMKKRLVGNWNGGRLRWTTFFCALTAAATATTAIWADDGEQQRWLRTPKSPIVERIKETRESVVSIQGEKQCEVGKRANAQYDVYNGMGTGVVVDERGYILTNYHVVKGLLKLEVVAADGERYRDVELIRNDVATDLAILKIKPKTPMKKIRMGRSELVDLAEEVWAIGNPYGYGGSVTKGIVSALGRPLEVSDALAYDSVIQTDAAVNPGNSGGPLINVDGEMIGLNAAVREEAENIAFAIPVDVVSEVAERMIRQSVAKMTHHGLKFRVVDAESPEYPVDGNGEDCLVVESVEAKSPAAQAGIEPGDVLVSSNGFEVRSSLDFTCSLIGMDLTDVAELRVRRGGETKEAVVAFSDLATARGETFAQRKPRRSGVSKTLASEEYADAETSGFVAESVDEALTTADFDGSETAPTPSSFDGSKRAAQVWRVLGVEVETISSEEYRERYPKLQAVSIGDFNFAPNGGVIVTRALENGLLAGGDARVQEGDLIFGFGVGDAKEGQLSVASLDNLYYIAQKKDDFARLDGGKARVYLIRGERAYFLEIDLNR